MEFFQNFALSAIMGLAVQHFYMKYFKNNDKKLIKIRNFALNSIIVRMEDYDYVVNKHRCDPDMKIERVFLDTTLIKVMRYEYGYIGLPLTPESVNCYKVTIEYTMYGEKFSLDFFKSDRINLYHKFKDVEVDEDFSDSDSN